MLTAHEIGLAFRKASDLTLASFFFVRATPETLLGEIYVGPIPLDFFLMMAGFCLEIIHVSLAKAGLFLSKPVAVLFLVYAFCLANGIHNENSMKFIAIDSICFLSMIYGTLWAGSRSLQQLSSTILYRFLFPVIFSATFGLIGTRLGVLAPARESTRLYTYSDFDAIFMLSALAPMSLLGFRKSSVINESRKRQLFIPILIACLLAFSTASRTGIAVAMTGLIGLSTLLFSGAFRVACAWIIAVLAIGFTYTSSDWGQDTQLMSRLASTSIKEEARYTEVKLMLEDLYGYELIGRGMGSRFATNIDFADRLAFAPHVGLLALVHKAGYLVFLVVFVIPGLICISYVVASALQPNRTEGATGVQNSFAWSVVICMVQMSMSSGWNPLHLVLISIAFSTMISVPMRFRENRIQARKLAQSKELKNIAKGRRPVGASAANV